ncbi:hypothetical protein MTO96_033746 [Rhipicephalus appendiculatus]
MAKRRMIWCAAWLERAGECVSRARGSGSKAASFAGRQVHGRTRSATSCHLSVTEALPACSARRRSGKGPGTRPGQASLLCAEGRTRDSAREHEEADYVCRSSSRGRNSCFDDRESKRPQHPPSYGIGRSKAFDPATSSATPNSRTMFDFRA